MPIAPIGLMSVSPEVRTAIYASRKDSGKATTGCGERIGNRILSQHGFVTTQVAGCTK